MTRAVEHVARCQEWADAQLPEGKLRQKGLGSLKDAVKLMMEVEAAVGVGEGRARELKQETRLGIKQEIRQVPRRMCTGPLDEGQCIRLKKLLLSELKWCKCLEPTAMCGKVLWYWFLLQGAITLPCISSTLDYG